METAQSALVNEQIKEQGLAWQGLKQEIKKSVIGHDYVVDRIIIGLLCNGHVLLEGVPGLAKTTLVKSLTDAIGLNFQRIQFTPDLLPADVIGTLIYNPKTQEFETRKGPIFTNVVLADEINRAPAKVQSALLEAMQERHVTIGEQTFSLPKEFLVLATHNPIDQEGTYRLPEAQVDRFMFKLLITYPKIEEEKQIIQAVFNRQAICRVLEQSNIAAGQELVRKIYVDDKVIDYILNIVFASREPGKYKLKDIEHYIEYGASPRATLAIYHAAQAHAFLRKRHFVIPDDVKAVVFDVLRHRILLTYEAEAEKVTTDQVIQHMLRVIPSP